MTSLPAKRRLVIVEDESDIRGLITMHLQRAGYEVAAFESAEAAMPELDRVLPDLAIFDWMLPGLSGLDLTRRYHGRMMILIVTARAETSDIVVGLSAGADDYLTKPFEIPVLLARVTALLRRASLGKNAASQTQLVVGDISVDVASHIVSVKGQPLTLTLSEFKLLKTLMQNVGRVLSREALISSVQGEDVSVVDRVVDTHVFAIRKKLGASGRCIETIRGVGYRIHEDPSTAPNS